MSSETPSRFDVALDDPKHDVPLHVAESVEDNLQQLAQEICQYDPSLAEVMFGMSFSTKSREERVAQIKAWGQS